MDNSTNTRKNLPRHGACSLELKGGTGEVKGFCSCKDFMEAYKADMTFQVQTPETLDPEEKDPNMGWVVKEIPGIGYNNQIVARLMVQSLEFVKLAFTEPKKLTEVTEYIRQCKELLLGCSGISQRVTTKVASIIEQIKRKEINFDKNQRVFNPFPQVEDLEQDCIQFLTNTKLYLQTFINVFNSFFDTTLNKPHYDKVYKHLQTKLGDSNDFYQWVKANEPTIEAIIEMRNKQEHPRIDYKLTIKNFSVVPGNLIQPPVWQSSGCPEQDIALEMEAITSFLLGFAELFIIFCVLNSGKIHFPYQVVQIPEADIDKDCPIRYVPHFEFRRFLATKTIKTDTTAP